MRRRRGNFPTKSGSIEIDFSISVNGKPVPLSESAGLMVGGFAGPLTKKGRRKGGDVDLDDFYALVFREYRRQVTAIINFSRITKSETNEQGYVPGGLVSSIQGEMIGSDGKTRKLQITIGGKVRKDVLKGYSGKIKMPDTTMRSLHIGRDIDYAKHYLSPFVPLLPTISQQISSKQLTFSPRKFKPAKGQKPLYIVIRKYNHHKLAALGASYGVNAQGLTRFVLGGATRYPNFNTGSKKPLAGLFAAEHMGKAAENAFAIAVGRASAKVSIESLFLRGSGSAIEVKVV